MDIPFLQSVFVHILWALIENYFFYLWYNNKGLEFEYALII